MKKWSLSAMLPFAGLLTGCSGKEGTTGAGAWPVVLGILGILVLAFALLRTWNYVQYCRRQKRRGRKLPRGLDMLTWCVYVLAGALIICGLLLPLAGNGGTGETTNATIEGTTQTSETANATTEPPVLFTPKKTASSDPDNWAIRWEIFQGKKLLHSYTRPEGISFGDPEDYFVLPGVSAFRGNNYRDSATYGTANVVEKNLSTQWYKNTGTLEGTTWSGNGWTGQPLIVKWDEETKKVMNLYSNKKGKADLVEVIYASLDGMIYFLDLDDGSQTRDPLNIGMCFKGAGTLDPRGYPLLYVGSGDENSYDQRPRMYIISLIDGKILYQGGYSEALSYRKDNDAWCAFDSSPLVDAKTDTLIWPGENGLLYTIELNTNYDKAAGTVSIDPAEPVVTRYHTGRSSEENYWYGYEASANVVGNYLYVSENGGMFYCVDLNTMELVWAQDTKDDSNSTPVFERVSANEGYVYTAPSLHWTQNANAQGSISIYKLDALTGEIVWEKPYSVHTVNGVSGGVQSSPLLGKAGTNIEGLILYTIARTNTVDSGTLVALNTETGEEAWRWDMDYYAWSSPVAFYKEDGTAYVVVCDSAGYATLIDGATGATLDSEYLGGLVEASPAVYEDMLVVGTRIKQICGVKIK